MRHRSPSYSWALASIWLAVIPIAEAQLAEPREGYVEASSKSIAPSKRVARSKPDSCLQDPQCKSLYERAYDLSQKKQYNSALSTYKAAYHRVSAPWLLVNIGRIYQIMGNLADAIQNYDLFLSLPGINMYPQFVHLAQDYKRQATSDLASQQAATPASHEGPLTSPPSVPSHERPSVDKNSGSLPDSQRTNDTANDQLVRPVESHGTAQDTEIRRPPPLLVSASELPSSNRTTSAAPKPAMTVSAASSPTPTRTAVPWVLTGLGIAGTLAGGVISTLGVAGLVLDGSCADPNCDNRYDSKLQGGVLLGIGLAVMIGGTSAFSSGVYRLRHRR